jgi:hypothetical protein
MFAVVFYWSSLELKFTAYCFPFISARVCKEEVYNVGETAAAAAWNTGDAGAC